MDSATKLLSDAAFGGTWRGPKQPGRTYGPAPREWAGNGPRTEVQPLDQRAREDRYRRQTGRTNRCPDDMEAAVDGRFIPAAQRSKLLGLTPKQRRRSEHKANRAEARMLPGGGRR